MKATLTKNMKKTLERLFAANDQTDFVTLSTASALELRGLILIGKRQSTAGGRGIQKMVQAKLCQLRLPNGMSTKHLVGLVMLLTPYVLTLAADHSSLSVSPTAQGATGVYGRDLSTVYGAVRAAGFTRDICLSSYPQFANQNEAGYRGWMRQYASFLKEFELRWREHIREIASTSNLPTTDVMFKMEEQLLSSKQNLEAFYRKKGAASFEGVCRTYPVFLKSGRANLEAVYVEYLSTIRKKRISTQ